MARSAKSIGILTFHNCINYGSYWQARCLAEGLRALGHDVEILDHHSKAMRRAELRCALQPTLPRRTPRAQLKSYAEKARGFVKAIAELPLSKRFPLHEPAALARYDAIVVGSDEVWNFRHPWYGGQPIFFGEGLRARRLISYAASFGNHSAWDGIGSAWTRRLGRFSAISVRDGNSWHLVRNSTSREPAMVLDPCLQFAEAIPSAPLSNRPPFALVYGHGFPAWLKSRVRNWAGDRHLNLLSIGYSNDFADEEWIAADPHDFAGLMGGAQAVITNFFHGCVFALLNGKPWASAPSEYRSIKIPDLAATLGTEHRLIDEATSQTGLAELLDTPIWPSVAAKINERRLASSQYLDAALS